MGQGTLGVGALADVPPEPITVAPPLSAADHRWLAELWCAEWGGLVMATRGVAHRLEAADALIARRGGVYAGAAAFLTDPGDGGCELLSLNAVAPGLGAGTALLSAVEAAARDRGCRRVWLVTGNDNVDALRFYQRRGYRLVAVHPGAIDAARRLKSTIPLVGQHGIPLHDEVELAKGL